MIHGSKKTLPVITTVTAISNGSGYHLYLRDIMTSVDHQITMAEAVLEEMLSDAGMQNPERLVGKDLVTYLYCHGATKSMVGSIRGQVDWIALPANPKPSGL